MVVPQLWQAEPSLRWVRFTDSADWVVYHPLAGTVHCMTDAARELWLAAADRPRALDEFVDTLSTRVEDGAVADLRQVVSETLAAMDRAGLMAPAGS